MDDPNRDFRVLLQKICERECDRAVGMTLFPLALAAILFRKGNRPFDGEVPKVFHFWNQSFDRLVATGRRLHVRLPRANPNFAYDDIFD